MKSGIKGLANADGTHGGSLILRLLERAALVHLKSPDGAGGLLVFLIDTAKADVVGKEKGVICTAHRFCLVY